jgi:hypothetical protein
MGPQVPNKELDGQQNRYLHKIAGRVKACALSKNCVQVVSEWVEYYLKLTAGKVVVALYAVFSVSKMCPENIKLHLHLSTLHQSSYLHVGAVFVL